MYSNLAKIKGEILETGVGQALFDNQDNPTKRYFLEKRWKSEGEILGVIMMNPSKAGALEGDKTVDSLIRLAKVKNYSALYVVNIIPYILSNSSKLRNDSLNIDSMVNEPNQIRSFEILFQKSHTILLAWGKTGQKYLPLLLKEENIKKLFENQKDICKVIGYGAKEAFPYHPVPRGVDKYRLGELGAEVKFVDASEKVKKWIEKM